MEVMEGKVGMIDYSLELVDGKVKLSGMFNGNGVDVGVNLALEPVIFLDKLKAIIPGKIDDAIIDGLKAALSLKSE
jgi:hypothetical protein